MPTELSSIGIAARSANEVSKPGAKNIGVLGLKESHVFPKVFSIGVVLNSANLFLNLVDTNDIAIGDCTAHIYENGVLIYVEQSLSGSFSLLIRYGTQYKIILESDNFQTQEFLFSYSGGINYIKGVLHRKVYAAAGTGGLYINADPSNPESNLFL